jgi:hypothetical protein
MKKPICLSDTFALSDLHIILGAPQSKSSVLLGHRGNRCTCWSCDGNISRVIFVSARKSTDKRVLRNEAGMKVPLAKVLSTRNKATRLLNDG